MSGDTPTTQTDQPWDFQPARDHGLSPAERYRSIQREPGLFSTTLHVGAVGALRAYLRLYHRLAIRGSENLPRNPPFVLIANHESHLDALILSAALPLAARSRVYPVAAGDVFFESIASSALSSIFINALPLWRKRATAHAIADLRDRLALGRSGYILFPAGARSRDGQMLPFKAGLGLIVAQTLVPVIPCFLEGPFEALPAGRLLPRPVKMEVRVGPALSFADVENTRSGWDEVARRARAAVDRLASP